MSQWVLASFGKPDAALHKEVTLYARRLEQLRHFSCVILKESRCSDQEARLQEEARTFTKKFPPAQWQWVVMAEEGRLFNTEDFASWLENHDSKPLVFLIGSAYGLHQELKQQAVLTWSLSPLTLTHEHARLILAEQLYRSVQVLRGHPYHHR